MPFPVLSALARGGRAVAARVPGRIGARARAAQRLANSRIVNPNHGRPTDHTGTTALERSDASRKNRDTLRDRHASAVGRAAAMIDAVDSMFPTSAHTITVHAKGGPSADLRRVWFLVVSACMGRFRDHGMAAVRGQAIKAEWDVTGKECSISLSYTVTGFISNMASAASRPTLTGVRRPANGLQLLMRGPDQVTRGAGWPLALSSTVVGVNNGIVFAPGGDSPKGPFAKPPDFQLERTEANAAAPSVFSGTGTALPDVLREQVGVGPILSGDPPGPFVSLRSVGPETALGRADYRVALGDKPPALVDAGRIITTGEKLDRRVQGPKPPVDGVSRASIVDMVAAALSSPGFGVVPPVPVVPVGQPLGSTGVFVAEDQTTLPGAAPAGYPGDPGNITGN